MLHCLQPVHEGARQISPVQPGPGHAPPPECEGGQGVNVWIGVHIPERRHHVRQWGTGLVSKVGPCVQQVLDTVEIANRMGNEDAEARKGAMTVSTECTRAAIPKEPASRWTCTNTVPPTVTACTKPGSRSTEATMRPARYKNTSRRSVPSAAAARTDT